MSLPQNESDDKHARTRRTPTLDVPIEVAKFFKNRHKDVIVITLSTYKDRNLVDIRQHFTNAEGQNRPTKTGVAMVVQRLPDLLKALVKAEKQARELGLLRGDE
jgi:hypothetical protein